MWVVAKNAADRLLSGMDRVKDKVKKFTHYHPIGASRCPKSR